MKKRIISIILATTLVFSMFATSSFATSKPPKATITSITVKGDVLTVTCKKVKGCGINVRHSDRDTKDKTINDAWSDIGENSYKLSVLRDIDDTYLFCGHNGEEPTHKAYIKVRLFKEVKQKQYYNSKKKKWVTKKPAKKYWKGKKTRKKIKKVYGAFSDTVMINTDQDTDTTNTEEKQEEQSKSDSDQVNYYLSLFTDKWYSALQTSLASKSGRSSQEELIVNNSFDKLSDAMKVWALGASKYFDCKHVASDYGMRYVNSAAGSTWTTPNQKAKLLYDGTAKGVCSDYTNLELMYFDYLNIQAEEAIYGSHSVSVVKAYNSNGKSLYIVFDYGAGIKTHPEDYSHYMEQIPGAPLTKNYTESDFN